MPIHFSPFSAVVLCGSILLCSGITSADPPSGRNWQLQWSDDFNGSAMNTSLWHYWNNNSWRDNQGHHVFLSGQKCISFVNGYAIIAGVHSNDTFYSAGLESNNGYGPGYYEARLKSGHAWAGFWIQGIGGDCAPITAGCEFDIMENCCPGTVQHNVHWSGYGSCHQTAQKGTSCSQDSIYTFGLQWSTQTGATFYVNGKVSHTVPAAAPNNTGAVRFTVESENSGEQFMIDYVRYYKDNGPATAAANWFIPPVRREPTGNGIVKTIDGKITVPGKMRTPTATASIYTIEGKLVCRIPAISARHSFVNRLMLVKFEGN